MTGKVYTEEYTGIVLPGITLLYLTQHTYSRLCSVFHSGFEYKALLESLLTYY